jgi:hypothetical protein
MAATKKRAPKTLPKAMPKVAAKAAKKSAAKAASAKTRGGKKSGPGLSKAAWIRKFGLGVAPLDILAESKKQGIALTLTRIYSVRGELTRKLKASGKTVQMVRSSQTGAPSWRPTGTDAAKVAAFRKHAMILGVEHARKLLAELEKRIASLLGR